MQYPKHPLMQKSLQLLKDLPHIKAEVTVEPYLTPNILADGQLVLHSPQATVTYIAEIKTHITVESLKSIIDYFHNLKTRLIPQQRPILLTSNLSDQVFNELINQEIELIDTSGNIYLNSNAFYLLIRRQKRTKKLSTDITNAMLQLMYVILQFPELLKSADIKKLTKIAAISLNTVKKSLDKLCELNYLKKQNNNRYKIIDYYQLLERWELGYVETLRNSNQIFIDTFKPIKSDFSEVAGLIIEKAKIHNYYIGGELGAAMVTKYLTPISAVLHVPEKYSPIFADLKLKPSPDGTITFLKNWSNFCNEKPLINTRQPYLANPLLIHAELMSSTNERLIETAQKLFNQCIAEEIKNV